MPDFQFAAHNVLDADVDVVIVGITQAAGAADSDDAIAPELSAAAQSLGERLGLDLAAQCRAADVNGAVGQTLRLPTRGDLPAPAALLVGTGTQEGLDAAALRRVGVAIAGATKRVATAATSLHQVEGLGEAIAARAIIEGIEIGAYTFDTYQARSAAHSLGTVSFNGGDDGAVVDGIRVGRVSAEATNLTRDLVNTPAGDKRPPQIADRVLELVADLPIDATVLDGAALEAGGYGGHLGVGRGSSVESRFVELAYRPDGATRHVALVGKGITFDSGGLSLKPPKAMEWMKVDMAGAATMLATIRAAAQLELDVAITALLCFAENMPSGEATRPGDILTILGGKTVEVLNTDAEGRLVLADGLVRSGQLEPRPDVVIDAATLTGALLVALGDQYTGVMGNDDELAAELITAGVTAGELMWQLPLSAALYAEDLKSDVADVRNIGGSGAGTIRAALFLNEFVPDDVKWAHLDIAGASWNDSSAKGYRPKNATGQPARALLDWFLAG